MRCCLDSNRKGKIMDRGIIEEVVLGVLEKTVMRVLKSLETIVVKNIELQGAQIKKLEKRVQEIEDKVGIVRLKMN
jgi:hypothetical protein